jgi:hypothetical protein
MTPQGFEHVKFTQQQLHDALRQLCPAALKAYDAATTAAMRAEWSPLRPTRFCCYFVSEMVYWYSGFNNHRAMSLAVPNDATLHRYVQLADGRIVDLTCDQFDFDLDYTQGKPRMFLQTGCTGPSKRAQQLASILGLQR